MIAGLLDLVDTSSRPLVTVEKSFVVLPSVISPVATRMAVPVTLAGPVCVIVPVEFTDRLLVLMEGRARLAPVMMLRLSSVVLEPIEPLKLTAPAPALIES